MVPAAVITMAAGDLAQNGAVPALLLAGRCGNGLAVCFGDLDFGTVMAPYEAEVWHRVVAGAVQGDTMGLTEA